MAVKRLYYIWETVGGCYEDGNEPSGSVNKNLDILEEGHYIICIGFQRVCFDFRF
jgi:hypothetical protein